MKIPVEFELFGYAVPVHLVLEYLAFFIGFRYYMYLRKKKTDTISTQNRLSIIIGAVFGALIGSRLMGFLEFPSYDFSAQNIINLLNTKTIMGGLFGGLLGVELTKRIIGEKHSSGDLFVFPIIVGIIIGRIGCFLSGINEFTYGTSTTLFTGINLGDGVKRHPIALYEIVFLIALFVVLQNVQKKITLPSGALFKGFMMSYFGFRFFIEFIKPNAFLLLGLSSIQYLCLLCLGYYLLLIKGYIPIFFSKKI